MKRWFNIKNLILAFVLVFALSFSVYAAWPVKFILSRTAVTISAGGTTFDTTVVNPGARATRYILTCFNSDGNSTRTLSIIDANSKTIWSGAAHADADTYSVPIDVELIGTYTFRLTLNPAAGGTGGTDYLTVIGE